MTRSNRGRHRKGTTGSTWCRDAFPSIDAALSRPSLARRGLFERLLAPSRHLLPRSVRGVRPALAGA